MHPDSQPKAEAKPIPTEDQSATLVWTPGPGSRATCQVGRKIGAGGFAEVFEAELRMPRGAGSGKSTGKLTGESIDPPPRRVALKRLLPGMRGDPLRQRQLRREAQIASALNHPNIVKVLSLIELGDEVALAMELVEGVQCNHLLHRLAQRGQRLRIESIAHITAGLFAALKYLENPLGASRPLVHADISLENLMLTTAGDVKLIDFGIAAENLSAAAAAPQPEEALTSLHQAAGKRPYLPPEGMSARGPSSQSDLYAAGVCFWELCTGRRFPVLPRGIGDRELGSLISFAAEGLPEPAWRLLLSCLALDRDARLRMAGEGLELCQRLGERAEVAAAMGSLVQAVMGMGSAAAGGKLPPEAEATVEPYDFFASIVQRVQGAFCAENVLAMAPVGEDPSGTLADMSGQPDSSQSGAGSLTFALRASYGSTSGPSLLDAVPPAALLREALDTGFVESPDGALLFRVRPPGPGERASVVCIQPGRSCSYDAMAQTILRNLLAPNIR